MWRQKPGTQVSLIDVVSFKPAEYVGTVTSDDHTADAGNKKPLHASKCSLEPDVTIGGSRDNMSTARRGCKSCSNSRVVGRLAD